MSRATRDAVAADTGSTPLSLCGSMTGAPMAVDPFDPAALALRLADARERRARALASRKAATDAGESRPPLARPGPRSLAFGSAARSLCLCPERRGGPHRPSPGPHPGSSRKRRPRHTRPLPAGSAGPCPADRAWALRRRAAGGGAGSRAAPGAARHRVADCPRPRGASRSRCDGRHAAPARGGPPGRGIGPGGRRDARCNGAGPPPATAGRGSGPAVDRGATGGAEQARRDRGDRGGAAFCSVGPHATRRARRVGTAASRRRDPAGHPTPARADCQRADRDRRAVPASVRAAGPPAEGGVGRDARGARQRSRGRPAEPAGDTGGAERRWRSRHVAGSFGRPRGNGTGPGGVSCGRTGDRTCPGRRHRAGSGCAFNRPRPRRRLGRTFGSQAIHGSPRRATSSISACSPTRPA